MTPDDLRSLPKVLLHDHLDGGLRPETVIELAEETGYRHLPTEDPAELARWFHQDDSGSLERYLAAFSHTIGVMQTAAALERVAREAVDDLAGDGVVYAEIRFAPLLHTRAGLTPTQVTAAVSAGIRAGCEETGLVAGIIVDAMRDHPGSAEVARLAANAGLAMGVVGFDLAGPEAGHPADLHLEACRIAHEAGLGVTLHAGEGDGPNSIWRAVARCGAARIGHGVHIVEDLVLENGEVAAMGRLARRLLDHRIPLEVCVSSNVDTGLFPDHKTHPVGALHRAGFAITLNTDNRLMSRTSLSEEFGHVVAAHRFTAADLLAVTETALLAGFGDWWERRQLLEDVVRPAYARFG